jgi:hypothetical protein
MTENLLALASITRSEVIVGARIIILSAYANALKKVFPMWQPNQLLFRL